MAPNRARLRNFSHPHPGQEPPYAARPWIADANTPSNISAQSGFQPQQEPSYQPSPAVLPFLHQTQGHRSSQGFAEPVYDQAMPTYTSANQYFQPSTTNQYFQPSTTSSAPPQAMGSSRQVNNELFTHEHDFMETTRHSAETQQGDYVEDMNESDDDSDGEGTDEHASEPDSGSEAPFRDAASARCWIDAHPLNLRVVKAEDDDVDDVEPEDIPDLAADLLDAIATDPPTAKLDWPADVRKYYNDYQARGKKCIDKLLGTSVGRKRARAWAIIAIDEGLSLHHHGVPASTKTAVFDPSLTFSNRFRLVKDAVQIKHVGKDIIEGKVKTITDIWQHPIALLQARVVAAKGNSNKKIDRKKGAEIRGATLEGPKKMRMSNFSAVPLQLQQSANSQSSTPPAIAVAKRPARSNPASTHQKAKRIRRKGIEGQTITSSSSRPSKRGRSSHDLGSSRFSQQAPQNNVSQAHDNIFESATEYQNDSVFQPARNAILSDSSPPTVAQYQSTPTDNDNSTPDMLGAHLGSLDAEMGLGEYDPGGDLLLPAEWFEMDPLSHEEFSQLAQAPPPQLDDFTGGGHDFHNFRFEPSQS